MLVANQEPQSMASAKAFKEVNAVGIRNIIEYIIDKRKTDSNTYSYLFPMHPYNLDNLNRIRWLGGISNSNIVLCRKNGQWLNIVSDRYGFNNKNDTWDENLNFAIVVESFIKTNFGNECYSMCNYPIYKARLNEGKYNNSSFLKSKKILFYRCN